MLGGHVPLETGETTRDELYLSGLVGERHRDALTDREREREGARGGGDTAGSPQQKTQLKTQHFPLDGSFSPAFLFSSPGEERGREAEEEEEEVEEGGEEEEKPE